MALTANYDTTPKDDARQAYPVLANVKIYKGAIVAVDPTVGYATNASDTAGLIVLGVAEDTVDNTGGANGAVSVITNKRQTHVYSTTTLTLVGEIALITDENTVDNATVNSISAGRVVEIISATKVRVDIQ